MPVRMATPSHWASTQRNVYLNLHSQDDWTALMLASLNGHHYEVVELLLKENADPNLQPQAGKTALMFAMSVWPSPSQ